MNLFEAAKSVDAKSFSESFLGLDFKQKSGNSYKSKSPFRPDERTPSFSLKENYFTDFGGDFKGGIIDLVMSLKSLDNIEAAKWICEKSGVSYEDNKKFEKQDKKSLDEIFAIQRDRLSKNFKTYLPHLQKIFCNLDFLVRYPDLLDALGWCDEHHTLTIGIVENGKIVNIKWRTKKNNPGKWISVFGGKQAFFPVRERTASYLCLLEGEKDALNLCAIGVNAGTLGGVSNSYSDREYLFSDIETTIIWFDYDAAGVKQVLVKAKEAYAAGVKQVLWMDMRRLVHNTQLFKKMDCSDYLERFPISSEEEFLALVQKYAVRIPKSKTAPDTLFAELSLLDSVLSPKDTHVGDISGVEEFKNILYSAMNPYENTAIGWAEAKKSAIDDVLSALDSEEYKKHIAILSTYKNELSWFRTEKRIAIAKYILSECDRIGLYLRRSESSLYFYNGKYFEIWKQDDFVNFYHNRLSDKIIDMPDSRPIENLYETLRSISLPLPDRQEKLLINLQNCVLDLENKKVRKHSPEYSFTYCLNFEYDKDATCPLFDDFMDSSLPDTIVQSVVYEFIAYSLMPTYSFQKFLLVTGGGSNGKSVLMSVMESFFSSDSVGIVETFEGFDLESLIGKQINFAKDKTLKGIKSVEIDAIKKIADGSGLSVRAMYKGAVALKNPPKLVISTNKLPTTTDYSFTRRMLLVPFEQTFSHDAEDPKYKIKIDLEKDIIATELPGIFNKVLAAMSRLISNKKFSDSEKLKNTLKEFELDNNNVYRFAHDMVVKDPTVAFISIQDIYNSYCEWCKTEGSQAKSKVNFGKDFKEYMKIEAKVVKVYGVATRGYECLRINAPVENQNSFDEEKPDIEI